MSLADLARQDLRLILQGGEPVTMTAPNGFSAPMLAELQDIAQTIDPQTKLPVETRMATATVGIPELQAAGFATLPVGVTSSTAKPWRVRVGTYDYKVTAAHPDRSLGVIVLHLEHYKVAA